MPRGRPPKGSTALTIIDDLQELLALWTRAAESPTGIKIASQKPNILFQKLHWARRECGHQGFQHLKVIETETEVWVLPR
jgi:hypothetical protein